MDSQEILVGLNPQQKAAVQQLNGPVLIVAGAGSGKTRVLTSRIAYAIAEWGDPQRLMALTFTKKAAGEMKERVAMMVGWRLARKLYMGTFHSVFIRFLRDYAECLGYPQAFTIYDTSDSQSLIKACIKELGLDDKSYKPKDVLSRISEAKNSLVGPGSYVNNPQVQQADAHSRRPRLGDIYALYWKKCRQSGVMDFDDILFNMNILLSKNEEARKEIASRFDYLMVDEYQDTNFAQYVILKMLCVNHSNICVVGDDSQSIYAFRGAKVENILRFEKDFKGTKVFRLERNYRSTQTIVNAANSVIEKNRDRIKKTCFSEQEAGDPIHLVKAFTDQEEAMLITASIMGHMQRDHAEYKDFAILYRTNAQSRVLEEQLRRRNIPYVIYSGNSFFERAEVKDTMAYFKLVVNPEDNESFKRIVNKPARGIGDTSLAAVQAVASRLNCSYFRAALNMPELTAFGLKTAAMERLSAFCKLIASAHEAYPQTDAHELAVKVCMDSGLWMHFKGDTSVEGQSRMANVQELLDSTQSFVEERQSEYLAELQYEDSVAEYDEHSLPLVTLDEFLENVSLLSAVDVDEGADGVNNKVALMTIHASKGLEFPYVYVTGLEENLFPSGSFGLSGSSAEIEEERRLFYVAMTRAGKVVTLSYCASRMRNGQHESNPPSRFLREIDSRYLDHPLPSVRTPGVDSGSQTGSGTCPAWGGSRASSGSRPGAGSSSSAPAGPSPLTRPVSRISQPQAAPREDFVPSSVLDMKAGQRVEHSKFGYGRIVTLEREGASVKAKVLFDNYGEKLLLLQYAKLRIVEE
ncbi:MAG: UvrD-helicase domain-containing protein [Bacteroidales bacterium]|nr:UvrD-helicase domain-containing protein [Bacteroidales bacterium]